MYHNYDATQSCVAKAVPSLLIIWHFLPPSSTYYYGFCNNILKYMYIVICVYKYINYFSHFL